MIHPQFDPVALQIGPLAIRWYGLMYLVGFVICYLLARHRVRTGQIPSVTREAVEDLFFFGVLGVILGGRIGFILFYKLDYYFSHPMEMFAVWQGGMSFHGGFLGVLVGLWWVARKHGVSWWSLTDFIAPMIPPGLGAGRLGNFINAELWGRVADPDLPWAMVFPQVGPEPRHPSQLYQFATEGILLFVLLWWYSSKARPRMAVSALFLIGYGGMRFCTEFFRAPDDYRGLLLFGWSTGQWLCVPMVLGGIALWVWSHRQRQA